MRKVLLGLAFLLGFASAAQAGQFVVVSSTDPAIRAGRELDPGETLPLGVGKTAVVIHASGAVTKLTGMAGGVTLPMNRALSADAQRVAVLRLLVSQPRTRRSGVIPPQTCPAAETLTDMDGIVGAARMAGCVATARQAFGAYVERALGEPLPPPET
jgi:hypothetical protein